MHSRLEIAILIIIIIISTYKNTYKIPTISLLKKLIAAKGTIVYSGIVTVIFSHLKITYYFMCEESPYFLLGSSPDIPWCWYNNLHSSCLIALQTVGGQGVQCPQILILAPSLRGSTVPMLVERFSGREKLFKTYNGKK